MISSAGVGLTALILVYVLFKRFTRPSLGMIRGPKSPSFIIGNLLELFQRPVGEVDFTWQTLYGNVIRFKGVFGEDQLMIADPKAVQTMFNTSAYHYPKQPNLRVMSRMVNGKGLLWAEGDDHKRHRRIMLPGFGGPESKAFYPIFKECADALSTKWLEAIGNSNGQHAEVNVLSWLSRGALDSIGHAAFNVQLNTIQNDSHPIAKKYENYCCDIFGHPSEKQIFTQAASGFVPPGILEWVTDRGSNPRLERARDAKKTVTDIARKLVEEKSSELLQGKGNRDVFTLLVKANQDANAKNKMSEEELLAQMCSILLAGHETTANSISWILLELARNPDMQSRLRAEIRKTEAAAQLRSDSQLTLTDLDAMPYLNAIVKEGLRFHPAAPHIQRIANRDDVVQLSKPILTESGNMINEILIPKGTRIVVSVAAYNRIKDLWGEDAHEFNPDRWLNGTIDEKKLAGVGVYSNLLTFLSGTRACLGWRFAVIEIQAFLAVLINQFEFSMTNKAERIVREPAFVMAPMVDGELGQLPLAISIAPQIDEI